MKNLKLMALITLLCYGQLALALTEQQRQQIIQNIENMSDDMVEERSETLNGFGYVEDGRIWVYATQPNQPNQYIDLGRARQYLATCDLLANLRLTDCGTFNQIQNFVLNPDNENNLLPLNLLTAVVGYDIINYNDYEKKESDAVIKHIIKNRNLTHVPKPSR